MPRLWEEIRGFTTPAEYKRFCVYIEGQVALGVARERSPDPHYEKGMISGGRRFENVETNETWSLVAPDFPFRGVWEKVDLA